MRTIFIGIMLIAANAVATAASGQQVHLDYVETLRDQGSLRGEALRPHKQPASPAEAATMLSRPTAVAADQFRVYVIDRLSAPGSSARIVIFDRGTRTVSMINSNSSPTAAMFETGARFFDPFGIAVDANGFLYVADTQQGQVFVLDRLGARLRTMGRTGELGYPAALAADPPRGRLYVADRHGGVVRAVTTLGDRQFEIGGPESGKGRVRTPAGIAVDRDGTCYVLDAGRRRVQVFDVNGKRLRSFKLSFGAEGAGMKPSGIAVDSDHHVYVTDTFKNAVHIYDADGSYLQSLGRMGSNRDEFWNPQGIFIDGQNTIYIADEMNRRIQVYQYSK